MPGVLLSSYIYLEVPFIVSRGCVLMQVSTAGIRTPLHQVIRIIISSKKSPRCFFKQGDFTLSWYSSTGHSQMFCLPSTAKFYIQSLVVAIARPPCGRCSSSLHPSSSNDTIPSRLAKKVASRH